MSTGPVPAEEPLAAIIRIGARWWRPQPATWLLLAVLVAVMALWSIWPGPALGQHECYVAETAREMLSSGDWVMPHYSGMPRLQKPPLSYWMVSALAQVTGTLSDAVARLPSALAAIALAGVMGRFGRRAFGTAGLGWFAVAVSAFSVAWLYWGHSAVVDMQLTLWCTLTGALFWLGVQQQDRARRIGLFSLMGVTLGLALLAKAPMPLAVLPPGFVLYLLVTGRGRRIGTYLLESLPAVAISLAIFLPWVLAVLGRLDSDLVGGKWYREFILRYSGEIGPAERHEPWWYYGATLLWLVIPWTLSLPEALAAPWLQRYRAWRDVLRFAFCIAIWNLVFLSTAGYKQPHYLLPAVPWFWLLLTPPVWRFFAGPMFENPRLVRRGGLILAGVAAAGLIVWFCYVRAERPAWAALAAPAAVVVALGLALTGLLLAARARLAALWPLLLTVAAAFCVGWVRLGPYMATVAPEKAFAAAVRRIVPDGTPVHSLERPDARLVYYGSLILPRVLSDLGIEERLRGREHNEWSARVVTVEAAIELLAQDRPVYIVAEYGNWLDLGTVVEFRALGPRLLHRQTRHEDNVDADWVLFANRQGAAAVNDH